MPHSKSLRVLLFRLISVVWTIATIGIAGVTGAFIFAHTTSLILVVFGILLVLFIGIGPLKLYQRRTETSPSGSVQIRQLDPLTAKPRAGMQWSNLSLGKLVIIQAFVAILFGYLMVSLFPKVPLLSACLVSIVFAIVVTLLLRLAIAWMRSPIEILGLDFWRNYPNDKQD